MVLKNGGRRKRIREVSLASSQLEMGQDWKNAARYFPALQPGRDFSLCRYHLVLRDLVRGSSRRSQQRDVQVDVVDHRDFHVDVHRHPGCLGSFHHCALLFQVWKDEAWKTRRQTGF